MAGVLGAGGFYAVISITLGSLRENVSRTWSSLNVLSMLEKEDHRGVSLADSDHRGRKVTIAISSIQIQ